jgi:hypothetical protein
MSKSWEQILGGYATGTLTEEEKRQLFEAALYDQTLFDTLADEEVLRALLADPHSRQRILASLQASETPPVSTTDSHRRLSWFRQPSSLAWVGGIAAMGLALIFGWQMEKDWGPLVQQEQEVESSGSEEREEKRDKSKVAYRSQTPETAEMNEPTQDQPKTDQREPEGVSGLSIPIPSPERSIIAKTSKDSEGMRQSSAQARSESLPRQEVQKERRLKAKESVPQPPESAIVQNVPQEKQRVSPPVVSPDAIEKAPQQSGRPPAFADKLEEGYAPSSPSARELFYANKSNRVDAVGEELDGMRAQQLLGGMSSQAQKGLKAEVSDLKESQEEGQVYSQGQARGIRYRFVQRAGEGKDEVIDIKQFSGKWSELQLVIESNVPGYLYVVTSYETGKWQWLRPGNENIMVLADGAIEVKPYQSLEFALSQFTNTLGKPVVSSITVLLSSTPLAELNNWLGRGISRESLDERLTENSLTGTIVIDRSLPSGIPFRVKMALKEE